MGILSNAGNAPANLTDNVNEMVLLYSHMITSMRSIQAKPSKDEEFRYHKLEVKVDLLWPVLSRDEQLCACRILVDKGFMHQDTVDLLLMVDGTIAKNNTPSRKRTL